MENDNKDIVKSVKQKLVVLVSDHTDYVNWNGQKIPISCVNGFQLDENGNLRGLLVDSTEYSKHAEEEQ